LIEGSKQPSVVYFDGVCNLCNGFVDFLIRHDSRGRLRYAPLQGSTAQRRLPANQSRDLMSMAFTDTNGKVYTESSAALKSVIELSGGFKLLNVFFLVPGFLRNAVYRMVAANRYRMFGRKDTCRLPTPAQRERFLD